MEQNTSRNSFWMALILVVLLALASGVSANKTSQAEPHGINAAQLTDAQL